MRHNLSAELRRRTARFWVKFGVGLAFASAYAPVASAGDLDSAFAPLARYSMQRMGEEPEWAAVFVRFNEQQLDYHDQRSPAENCIVVNVAQCRLGHWQSQISTWQGLPRTTQLMLVDAAVNKLTYVSDQQNWGMSDHWQTPLETLERGGDCEDLAITKYFALIALGFDKEALRVVIVWDADDHEEHAVLIARVDNDVWLLDNKLASPERAVNLSARYKPIYSINSHGQRIVITQPSSVAAAFAGAKLSKNGKMLVWQVRSKTRRTSPLPISMASGESRDLIHIQKTYNAPNIPTISDTNVLKNANKVDDVNHAFTGNQPVQNIDVKTLAENMIIWSKEKIINENSIVFMSI
jgi:predicted transglutaminase-like cysteine proteinase